MNFLRNTIVGLVMTFFLSSYSLNAQQEGFLGEIKMFAGNFAPRGWAFCEGQLLAISSNTALFSILGCQYGGDCRTTFALPDFRGRVAISAGRGPGLQNYPQASKGGGEFRTLNLSQMPQHNHSASFTSQGALAEIAIPTVEDSGNEEEPGRMSSFALLEDSQGNDLNLYSTAIPDTTLRPFQAPLNVSGTVAIGFNGGNQAFDNRQPYTTVRYIICLQGVFPSRS